MTAEVDERFGCPGCQERRADELVWQGDNGKIVRCSTCGTEYNPLASEAIKTKGEQDAWHEEVR
jgi:transcription elongation factor Elf1